MTNNDPNDPKDWPDDNPLKVKMLVAQREEFRERSLRARQALIDARRAFERDDMDELRRILRQNTPMFWKKAAPSASTHDVHVTGSAGSDDLPLLGVKAPPKMTAEEAESKARALLVELGQHGADHDEVLDRYTDLEYHGDSNGMTSGHKGSIHEIFRCVRDWESVEFRLGLPEDDGEARRIGGVAVLEVRERSILWTKAYETAAELCWDLFALRTQQLVQQSKPASA